ncbi:MAG: ABC transporter ATP-binding protein [Firmicutes bacterium]|nr:ABC transporter ATP-binding protein [Bacillota bacterium]MCD8314656.1 ABC transporter ATP-binding protein [Bacillota bacterium]
MALLELDNIGYSYVKGKPVFEGISYSFDEGKMYAVMGKSGAGKTTLLSLLSGLAKPTEGKILYEGRDITEINQYEYRSKYVGVVFQSFNLLTKLTAAENIVLSMEIAGLHKKDEKERAYELLDDMGLDRDEADRRVLKLSGGQQQRVAIARALSYGPHLILADEPTGNLDGETQNEIMDIFRELADSGKCVIIVTHSQEVANRSDEIYRLVAPEKKTRRQKKIDAAKAAADAAAIAGEDVKSKNEGSASTGAKKSGSKKK